MLTPLLSKKFRFWTFVSMFVLVFVHGYNLHRRYLEPWTLPDEPLTITAFTEYFLANGLFRFRIPMLFIISGFLYATFDEKPNRERIPKRIRTLLVPYLIWSAVGLGLTFLLELFPYTRDMVASSHVVQIDETRVLIHEYKWYEVLARWIFFPVAYQLWFIRVLLIYNLAYPLIRWCVTHPIAKWIYFGLVFLFWLSTGGLILVEGEGLLFFSLGIWIQKTKFNIEIPEKWIRPTGWGVLFVLLSALKTFLAFKGFQIMGDAVYPVISVLHKTVVVSGLIACWFSSDKLVHWCMDQKWFLRMSAYSFMIYVLHAPLVAFVIDTALNLLGAVGAYRILAFLLLPIAIIGACIIVAVVLQKAVPKTYSLLTGGRTA